MYKNYVNIDMSKSIRIQKDQFVIPLPIAGQGVFLFEYSGEPQGTCSYSVSNATQTDGLHVEWSMDGVHIVRMNSLTPYVDPKNSKGLTDKKGAFYWFSLNAQNQTICAGVGEARQETSIYQYTLPFSTDDERKANKAFLESLITIYCVQHVSPCSLLHNPITKAIPLCVKHVLSLDSIAKGIYMHKSHLSAVSQQMYECVVNCVLDTDDFPDFSRAIQQSIQDGWCKQRLIEKSNEFSKVDPNLNETYLRITLGENNGDSPGIPYVMEIWPAGHYSPIHSHANAEAIIKVLHGTINVTLFPFLGGDSFTSVDIMKEDMTWISPNLTQIHQLLNRGSDDVCITIQCYMYDQKNHIHYDYFDYLDDKNAVQQYEPDSDMDFVAFKELIRNEWENRKPNKKPNGLFACFNAF
jgi:hypothetical protein